jgi:hypothetical protein
MTFREATDSLCAKVDHEDIATALGISVQAIRQARVYPEAHSHRLPPNHWEHAVIRLAEERVWYYRQLIENLRKENMS